MEVPESRWKLIPVVDLTVTRTNIFLHMVMFCYLQSKDSWLIYPAWVLPSSCLQWLASSLATENLSPGSSWHTVTSLFPEFLKHSLLFPTYQNHLV